MFFLTNKKFTSAGHTVKTIVILMDIHIPKSKCKNHESLCSNLLFFVQC